GALALLGPQLAQPVMSSRDEVEVIHLEEIAALLVHDQSADHEGGVVLEIQDLPGISLAAHQLLLGEIERQLLDRNGIVVRQRVIEIEADRADLGELQIAVRSEEHTSELQS